MPSKIIRVALSVVFAQIAFAQAAFAAFTETPLSFKGDGITLQGTLTMPQNTSGKVPAVLLLSGSGPTDRDGNQPPSLITDNLKQIAHELADKGFASYRFDKREVRTNQMSWPSNPALMGAFFSWEHHQTDIEAAFHAMADAPSVDRNHLVILGHSEGGLYALSLAKKLSPHALVLLSTPGRTFGALVTEQIGSLLDQQGALLSVKSDYLAKNAAIQKYIVEKGAIPPDVPAGLKALYPPSAAVFYKSVLNLDPLKFAKAYRGPVFVMNGQLDKQVSAERDAQVLFKTLQNRGSTKQDLYIVPGAGHDLKTGASVDSGALTQLVGWLKKN